MNSQYLCMAALMFGDATGYDIRKRFEDGLEMIQDLNYGSIYPALARLVKANWATMRVETPENGPVRKVYALTDSGREAFLRHLTTVAPTHQVKSTFLLQMLFADQLPSMCCDHVLQRRSDIIAREHILIHTVCQNAPSWLQNGLDRLSRYREHMLAAQEAFLQAEMQRHSNTSF